MAVSGVLRQARRGGAARAVFAETLTRQPKRAVFTSLAAQTGGFCCHRHVNVVRDVNVVRHVSVVRDVNVGRHVNVVRPGGSCRDRAAAGKTCCFLRAHVRFWPFFVSWHTSGTGGPFRAPSDAVARSAGKTWCFGCAHGPFWPFLGSSAGTSGRRRRGPFRPRRRCRGR